ncbi:DUF2441 domain-containing protein [Citrobacter koseri]|nr:DUF2441 domain-containing protein [Citrobacter koseri]ELG4624335.1 DUF2441 domain-containing protein [Citrobacter koseri]EMD6813344.1 DUF2441 domain-containing protein [Citrobacter koseri]SQB09548.1 Uncharacterised protein [Citrobacter koseri]STB48119.1 Uncharacterised protein [Citrobacter koseri]
MLTYYAVDRRGLFKQNERVQLATISDTSKFSEQAAIQFNAGISPHGITYFIGDNFHVHNNVNQPAACIEYALELLRQQRYPEKPSRFLSVFGCETLDGAKHFRGQYEPHKLSTPIYEITSNGKVHKGDMNLLDARCPVYEFENRLDAYWSGESYPLYESYEPFWEIIIPLPANIGALVA